MVKMICPKCNKGIMKLEVRTKGAIDPRTYTQKGGAKLVCPECGNRALPSEVRQTRKSN